MTRCVSWRRCASGPPDRRRRGAAARLDVEGGRPAQGELHGAGRLVAVDGEARRIGPRSLSGASMPASRAPSSPSSPRSLRNRPAMPHIVMPRRKRRQFASPSAACQPARTKLSCQSNRKPAIIAARLSSDWGRGCQTSGGCRRLARARADAPRGDAPRGYAPRGDAAQRAAATGSLAPTDLRPPSLEEEIGTAVRRLRKGHDLTVVRAGRRRRHLGRHAVEDRERHHLALPVDDRRAGQGAQRLDRQPVRRIGRTARLLVRQGRPGPAHRTARHQGRAPL